MTVAAVMVVMTVRAVMDVMMLMERSGTNVIAEMHRRCDNMDDGYVPHWYQFFTEEGCF
jgi:hypothetical protein